MQMMHLWSWIKASSIGDNTAGGVTGYIKAILANKHPGQKGWVIVPEENDTSGFQELSTLVIFNFKVLNASIW